MNEILRLSEHPISQKWISQFYTPEDRALAKQLLDQLKIVSAREFESCIEKELIKLQTKLNATIAVYPIAPPIPDEIAGYDPFAGGLPKEVDSKSREIGRRRKFGSEDRVGHVLSKLQDRFRRGSGVSSIECAPTLTQLKTQKIRHIVLVDDVCGSGKRITDYWASVPKSIKSLLSLKKCELWILLYTITPKGKAVITKEMPNFPSSHLITVIEESNLELQLTEELRTLCVKYSAEIEMESAGLGYRGSSCSTIFEHGCPNNLPVILWAKNRHWSGLFPNRAIPTEMRPYFNDDVTRRLAERLWRSNQPKLALRLVDELDHIAPLATEHKIMLTILGLRQRGIQKSDLSAILLIQTSEIIKSLELAQQIGLYDIETEQVTILGKEFINRFRNRSELSKRSSILGMNSNTYYPQQCEGKLRQLGKTDRGNGRSGPMELP